MEELQEEEREVIMSIYDCDPAFKQLSPITYQYKYGEEGDSRSFLLEIIWGKEYPNEAPKVNMDTFYNKQITDSTKKRICNYVTQEALNLIGNAMTYSLFESVKEKYFELVVVEEGDDNKESNDSHDEENDVNDDDDDDDDDEENKESEACTSQKKDKKSQLTKAQKRKQWNRVDCHGERPRGWNWTDVIHHLSQTGPKGPEIPFS